MATCSGDGCDARVTADHRHVPFTPGDDIFCAACCPRSDDSCVVVAHRRVRAREEARAAAVVAAAGAAEAARAAAASRTCKTRAADDSSSCEGLFGPDDACCDLHCDIVTCTVNDHVQKSLTRYKALAEAAKKCRGGADSSHAGPAASPAVTVHVTVAAPVGGGGSTKNASTNWYGLTEDTIQHHPTRFDDARVTQLLCSIRGPSIDDMRLTRHCKRAFTAAKGASSASAAPSADLLFREPLTTVLMGASLRDNTTSSERKSTAGLIAVMRAIAGRDAGKTADDPSAITVPAASVVDGAEGTLLAYEVLSENLVHTLETIGRNTFLTWTKNATTESRKDPIKLVRAGKNGGPNEHLCWVTACVKIYLIGYREFLTKRRHTWMPPALVELLVGPHHPWSLRDAPDSTTNLLAFFVVIGLLTLVDDADEDGDVAADSLTAAEEGFKAFLRAWKATFVSCSANRALWDKAPIALRAIAQSEATDADRNPPPVNDRRRGTRSGDTRNPKVRNPAAGGAGEDTTRPPHRTSDTAVSAGAAATPTSGQTQGPHIRVEGPIKQFSKCHWVGVDGAPCGRPPLRTGVTSPSPLCTEHRKAFHALGPQSKAAVVAKMRANGVQIVG